jgi:hypothetical protein
MQKNFQGYISFSLCFDIIVEERRDFGLYFSTFPISPWHNRRTHTFPMASNCRGDVPFKFFSIDFIFRGFRRLAFFVNSFLLFVFFWNFTDFIIVFELLE